MADDAVVVDMADPNAPARDTQGRPVAKEYRLGLENVTEQEARVLAKAARTHNMNNVADGIDKMLGSKTDANFIDRHPLITGFAAGAAVTGGAIGSFFGIRKLYRRRQLAKMGGQKVVSLPRR